MAPGSWPSLLGEGAYYIAWPTSAQFTERWAVCSRPSLAFITQTFVGGHARLFVSSCSCQIAVSLGGVEKRDEEQTRTGKLSLIWYTVDAIILFLGARVEQKSCVEMLSKFNESTSGECHGWKKCEEV